MSQTPEKPDEIQEAIAALAQPKASTRIIDILEAVIRKMGGVDGLADEIKKDFDALAPGANGRITLESNLIRVCGNFGDETVSDDIEPEELEAMLRKMIGEGQEHDV